MKRRKRRTHYVVEFPNAVPCPHCGKLMLPHRVCPHCGYYKGKQVVEVEAEE